MTMEKVYYCNVCKERVGEENLRELFGVHFSSLEDFTLGAYGCTDGVHICYKCARQLRTHLNGSTIIGIMKKEDDDG